MHLRTFQTDSCVHVCSVHSSDLIWTWIQHNVARVGTEGARHAATLTESCSSPAHKGSVLPAIGKMARNLWQTNRGQHTNKQLVGTRYSSRQQKCPLQLIRVVLSRIIYSATADRSQRDMIVHRVDSLPVTSRPLNYPSTAVRADIRILASCVFVSLYWILARAKSQLPESDCHL